MPKITKAHGATDGTPDSTRAEVVAPAPEPAAKPEPKPELKPESELTAPADEALPVTRTRKPRIPAPIVSVNNEQS